MSHAGPVVRGKVTVIRLALAGATSAVLLGTCTATYGATIDIPACGSNASQNTKDIQKSINDAPTGTTLVLPSGTCVVAKCEFANGKKCYYNGHRHLAALYVDNKQDLTITGADNTSVLKLDPMPLPVNGFHGYCGEAHVLTIRHSREIDLQHFTIDGSDEEFDKDGVCAVTDENLKGRVAERMFNVYVLNSTDVDITNMTLLGAHGDGVYLIAERKSLDNLFPWSERIRIRHTKFISNDRSGVALQRNVRFVRIEDSLFRNSGDDQDIDMEPSRAAASEPPQDIVIKRNTFERVKSGASAKGLAVTLGSKGAPAMRITFAQNTIVAAAANPDAPEGGCVRVYNADTVLIADNTIFGSRRCITLDAFRVRNLTIERNRMEGRHNVADAQTLEYAARGVLEVREHIMPVDPKCKATPKKKCKFQIYYPSSIFVRHNHIYQHIDRGPGIRLSNPDGPVSLKLNVIANLGKEVPEGTVDKLDLFAGITIRYGAHVGENGVFVNEKSVFAGLSAVRNSIQRFARAVVVRPAEKQHKLTSVSILGNKVASSVALADTPIGFALRNLPNSAVAPYVGVLTVTDNKFGCGFPGPAGTTPPTALLRPAAQVVTGTIGVVITDLPCCAIGDCPIPQ